MDSRIGLSLAAAAHEGSHASTEGEHRCRFGHGLSDADTDDIGAVHGAIGAEAQADDFAAASIELVEVDAPSADLLRAVDFESVEGLIAGTLGVAAEEDAVAGDDATGSGFDEGGDADIAVHATF